MHAIGLKNDGANEDDYKEPAGEKYITFRRDDDVADVEPAGERFEYHLGRR